MKSMALSAVAVLLAVAGAGEALAARKSFGAQPPPASEGCDVAVAFGSHGEGIDRTSFDWVEVWLGDNADLVSGVRITAWATSPFIRGWIGASVR